MRGFGVATKVLSEYPNFWGITLTYRPFETWIVLEFHGGDVAGWQLNYADVVISGNTAVKRSIIVEEKRRRMQLSL
jgi:hypothetical protein